MTHTTRCFVRGCTDKPVWMGRHSHLGEVLICDQDRWRVNFSDRKLLPGAKTRSVKYAGTPQHIAFREEDVSASQVEPVNPDVSRYALIIDGEEISTNEFVKPLIDALTQYAQGDEFTEATIKVRKQ